MAKFRFALQSVLEHREHLEREAQVVLGRAQALMRELEQERDAIKQELLDLPRVQKEALLLPEGATAHSRLSFVEWGQTLQVRLARARDKAVEQGKVVEKARQALLSRTRDRRALEILREKNMKEFQLELKKTEAKVLDEHGQNLFLRREESRG